MATKSKKTATNQPKTTKHPHDSRIPKIGTTLTRAFKGKEIAVKVTKDGFEYEGETYKSISAVARHITGYMISGPVFFKLAGHKPDPQSEANDG